MMQESSPRTAPLWELHRSIHIGRIGIGSEGTSGQQIEPFYPDGVDHQEEDTSLSRSDLGPRNGNGNRLYLPSKKH